MCLLCGEAIILKIPKVWDVYIDMRIVIILGINNYVINLKTLSIPRGTYFSKIDQNHILNEIYRFKIIIFFFLFYENNK